MITIFSFNYSYSQNSYRLVKSVGNSFFSIASRNNRYSKDAGDSAFRIIQVYDKKDKKVFSQKILITRTSDKDSLLVKVLATEINDTTEINPVNQASAKNIQRILLVNSANIKDESPLEDIFVSSTSDDKNTEVSKLKDTLLSKIRDKPITVHGSVNITGQLSDNKYLGQAIPQNYIRTQINAEVTLFGAPFNMGYYYTTENNSELNRINNFRVSFNYEKFYQGLKNRVDQRIKAEEAENLRRLTKFDINELNKEFGKLTSRISSPEFQKQVEKYMRTLQQGETDSLFKKTYRYKKALQQTEAYKKMQERLQEIGKLKEKFLINSRIANMGSGIRNIESASQGGFKKSLKAFGLSQPGYNLLLDIKKLDFGTFDPNYTTLVLSGVSLTGVNAEINHGNLYGAFTWGNSVANFSNPFAIDLSGGRTIMSSRIGIGRTEKMLIAFSVLKGYDGSNNIVKDTSYTYYLPQYNYVTGMDFKYKFNNIVDVGFEYAKSENREILKETRTNSEAYGSLLTLANKKYSSAWNGSLNINLNESNTKFRFLVRSVDPFYYSFGTPYLRKDNLRTEAKAEQAIWKKQLSASVTYRHDEDNLYNLKESTTKNNAMVFNLQLRIKKYPFFIFSYIPNYQSTFNTFNKQFVKSDVKVYNGIAGYVSNKKNYVLATTLSYTKQYNETTIEGFNLFHTDQYSLTENILIKAIDMSVTSNMNYTIPLIQSDTGKIIVASVFLSKNILKKKINVNGGYAYQKDFSIQQRNIVQAGTSFSLGWGVNCTIKIEKHFIKNYRVEGQNKDMNLGRITLIKSF